MKNLIILLALISTNTFALSPSSVIDCGTNFQEANNERYFTAKNILFSDVISKLSDDMQNLILDNFYEKAEKENSCEDVLILMETYTTQLKSKILELERL